jgi:hypothetical protein
VNAWLPVTVEDGVWTWLGVCVTLGVAVGVIDRDWLPLRLELGDSVADGLAVGEGEPVTVRVCDTLADTL